MSTLEIHQIPTRSDNYVYLLRESSSENAAVVDPSDSAPVLNTIEMFGWNLTHIPATHHHDDHLRLNKPRAALLSALKRTATEYQ